ncbi:NAD(P)-binding protein [Gyrodon lividus]|nr:NAD(P)-binding protein [Gyrodon lividus]
MSPFSLAAGIMGISLVTLYLLRSRRPCRTSKIPLTQERVLILGATSGVGRTLAHKYASRGAFVCIVGRRAAKLDEVVQECKVLSSQSGFNERVLGIRGDCADVQDMVQLRDGVQEAWNGLDTLIFTAGVSALQPLMSVAGVDMLTPGVIGSQANAEGIQHAVNAATAAVSGNFIGPYVAAITFIPLLSYTSPSPSIMLLSSIGAVIPAPTRSLYASTKSASLLLYQALSIEHPSITFTSILPGTIEGDFRASAVDNPPGASAPRIHEADPKKHGLKREFVANRCIRAIDKGERAVFTPLRYRAAHLAYWLWPAFIERGARAKYNFK